MHPHVQETATALPHAPGVYLFKDGKGKVLYVGKAQDLKKRVASYMRSGGDGRYLLRFLEQESMELDFLVTETEQEALLLENTLIKKFKPKHNIRLKDDKAYLMLRLDLAVDWPWFRFVRRRKNDGAEYYGPFSSARSIRRTLKLLHRIVPLRDCSDGVFFNRSRPCLKHQIGRCPAPCVGLIGKAAYRELLDRARAILGGETKEVEKELRRRMDSAAAELRFEEAQAGKEDLEALRRITEKQRVSGVAADRDVIGFFKVKRELHIAVLSYRDHGLEGSKAYHFTSEFPPGELLAQFLTQSYIGDRYIPAEVLLPLMPFDASSLQAWLTERRGTKVVLFVPQRGEKRRAVEMAERNARLAGEVWSRGGERSEQEQEAVRKLLGLADKPERIHCLDVSTIGGSFTVASRVSAVAGKACSEEYRRFRIKGTAAGDAAGDDCAAMRQAVARSLRLCLEREAEELPDLLLIDGGKGQVAAACRAMADCGLDDEVFVVGLAKDRVKGAERRHTGERLFLPKRSEPIPLKAGSLAWCLLTRVRDEAHRFAITYHRKLRGKLTSSLDEIKGLGPTRRRALLKQFGSLAAIGKAGLDEIRRVPGLPIEVAQRVFERFHEAE